MASTWVKLAMLLLVSPFVGAGNSTLTGPTAVVAEPDGSFAYTWVLTAGPGGELLAFWDGIGGENTDFNDFVADAECIAPLPEGDQIMEDVEGSLRDLKQPGSVRISISNCSGDQWVLETAILPPAVEVAVPTLSAWALAGLALMLLVRGAAVSWRSLI